MGCSNHHPHCQIWASSFLPNEPRIKDINQREYMEKYGRPMLMDYVERELKAKVDNILFLRAILLLEYKIFPSSSGFRSLIPNKFATIYAYFLPLLSIVCLVPLL